MLNSENMQNVEQRRLAWRCRRGMLELDIMLQRFVVRHFSALSTAELHAFDEMLALPDNEFWSLINESSRSQNPLQLVLIEKLKGA